MIHYYAAFDSSTKHTFFNKGNHALASACTNASSIHITPCVWRFAVAFSTVPTQIVQWCESCQADYALMPAQCALSDYRVLVMDMDSTLITIECIDEIADFVGLKQEVAAITQATMRGEIADFKTSLIERVKLLKGTPVNALKSVFEQRLHLSPGANILLGTVQKAGLKTALVSGGFTFFTNLLQKQLGLDCAIANQLEIKEDRLTGRVLGTIIDAAGKADALTAMCEKAGCSPCAAIAIGDGVNDLNMMQIAGLSIAYHAKAIVRKQGNISIKFNGLDSVSYLFSEV